MLKYIILMELDPYQAFRNARTNRCSYRFQVCSFVRLAMRNCVSLDVHLNGGQKKFAHCDLWISLICLIFFMKNSMGKEEGMAKSWMHLEDT